MIKHGAEVSNYSSITDIARKIVFDKELKSILENAPHPIHGFECRVINLEEKKHQTSTAINSHLSLVNLPLPPDGTQSSNVVSSNPTQPRFLMVASSSVGFAERSTHATI